MVTLIVILLVILRIILMGALVEVPMAMLRSVRNVSLMEPVASAPPELQVPEF